MFGSSWKADWEDLCPLCLPDACGTYKQRVGIKEMVELTVMGALEYEVLIQLKGG